jgi:POT family proton-dependent oligopeptide transporter
VVARLAHGVGWDWGFGAAGVGMLISIAIYLSGRQLFPSDPPLRKRGEMKVDRPAMVRSDWNRVFLLVLMVPVLAAAVLGNQQIFVTYLVWADKSADLTVLGIKFFAEDLVSADAFVSVGCLAGMVVFWRLWAKRFQEPDEFGKIFIGCVFGAVGVACLGLGALVTPDGGKVSVWWLLAFHLLNDIGFANVLPVSLALFARAAPRAIAGSVVGIYYLFLFTGNAAAGWLGTKLEQMGSVQFWLMHGVIVAMAGVVILLLSPTFRKVIGADPALATV